MIKKKILLTSLLLAVFSTSSAQNSFPQPQAEDATINTAVPAGHGSGYKALWFPNSTAVMPENSASYAGISITSNVIRSGPYNWGFANPGLPAWQLFIGHGPLTDGFAVARSAPNTYAMTSFFDINAVGNVGIGTSSPQSLVEIQKNAPASQGPVLELTNSGAYETASSEMYFSTYSRQGSNPSARIKVADDGDWGGDFYFDTKGTANNAPLYTRLYIDGASGYVGIGSTSPDQQLSVNGTVHAKAVLVDMNVFPDYVFNRNYKLASLTDLKVYIHQNHHLPGIPSAAQVAEDGINLGEMNTRLLKKIEELTLYLIEKDMQDKKKESLLRSQQARLNRLEKQLRAMSKKSGN